MSRSYRKPYSAVTGVRSAADDKRVARRCWRRTQNHALRSFNGDWDEFLIPARYEASFNDVWGWGRDGNQYLRFPPVLDGNLEYIHGCYSDEELLERLVEDFEREVQWYEYLKRK